MSKSKKEIEEVKDETIVVGGSEQTYYEVHTEILVHGKATSEHLLFMSKALKRMKDEELYVHGGFASFEDYSEQALGLKKSQAYKYINALESVGEEFFHSSGKIGITKIALLATLSEEERKVVTENTDIESVTVKELNEQIKNLRETVAEKEEKIFELENSTRVENSEELESAKKDATLALEESRQAKADAERQKAETDKLKAKLEKAEKDKKALEEKLKNQPVKTVENAETVAERDKARAELEKKNAEIAQLNKKLMVAGDTALTEFKIKFNDWQRLGSELLGLLERLNAETKEKSKAAFNAVIAGWQR